MKSVLIVFLLCISAFSLQFDEKEIFSLTREERVELMQKLPPQALKQLADSLTIWTSRKSLENTQKMLESYPKELEKIQHSMATLAETLQAQIGFSMITIVISFLFQIIFVTVMYRKVRTIEYASEDEEKKKPIIKGRKFYRIWLIVTISIMVVYAIVLALIF